MPLQVSSSHLTSVVLLATPAPLSKGGSALGQGKRGKYYNSDFELFCPSIPNVSVMTQANKKDSKQVS